MTMTSFTIKCGGLSISQTQRNSRDVPRMTGSFHRLTPEQFDALTGAFDLDNGYKALENKIETLTVPETGKKFRTAAINMGGLIVTLFADVVGVEVDPNQLSLLDA